MRVLYIPPSLLLPSLLFYACFSCLVVSAAPGRQLVWGSSSIITPNNLFSADVRRGTELAFNATNARSDKMGALLNYNLSTIWLNDNENMSVIVENVITLLEKLPEEFFGFLVPSDLTLGTLVTYAILKMNGLTTIPLVNPYSMNMAPLTPFQPWVFNTLPSNLESLTYVIVQYLASQQLFSRFSLLTYPPAVYSKPFGSSPLSALLGANLVAGINVLLSSFGLELVSWGQVVSPQTVDQGALIAAAQNISLGKPQAVILAVMDLQSVAFIELAKDKILDPGVVYIAQDTFIQAIQLELTAEQMENVLVPTATPLLTDTSQQVVNQFWSDLEQYDPGWKSQEGGIIDPAALNGYINGLWIAAVLETIRPSVSVNRTVFIDAVYNTPILNVAGLTMGPFYSDCSQTGCQACCNSGLRSIRLIQFINGSLAYLPENSKLSWQSCFPQPSDVQVPYKFGQSVTLTNTSGTSPKGTAIALGLSSGFQAVNNQNSFNGRSLVLISENDFSQPQVYGAKNVEDLISQDNVLALVGLRSAESTSVALNITSTIGTTTASTPIIGFLSGSPSLGQSFNPSLISITGSSWEEIAGALNYFVTGRGLSKVGIFYEATSDGELTREGLIKALALQEITLAADVREGSLSSLPAAGTVDLWMVYNPEGQLVLPFLQSLSSPMPVCILSSLDPDLLATNLGLSLVSSSTMKRSGGATWPNLSEVFFTQCLPNPNSVNGSSSSTSQLISNYRSAMASFNPALQLGYTSFFGYVNARLLQAILSNTNGVVTGSALLQTIYSLQTVALDDLVLGPYSDHCISSTSGQCCNKGTRNVYVVSPSLSTTSTTPSWTTLHNYNYTQCQFLFNQANTGSSEGGSSLSSGIIALIAIMSFLGAVLLLALGLGLCITVVVRDYMARHSDQTWEIEFEEIELGELLGQGGFGEVYQAQWRGTEVAVKILTGGGSIQSREQKESFREETRVMSQLRHPNVVLFMGSCSSPMPCIVMEFMTLGCLYNLLHNELVVEIPVALQLKMLYQAAKGMHFLHSSGIVHRDFKSLNLLLDSKWNLKVADFGLTRFKSSLKAQRKQEALMCSIPWTAPEVLEDQENVDYSLADVYSFGVIMWEMVSRRDPYTDLSPAQIAVRVIRDDLRPNLDEKILDECSPAYVELMQMCWSRDHVSRPVFLDIMTYIQSMSDSSLSLTLRSSTASHSNGSSRSFSSRNLSSRNLSRVGPSTNNSSLSMEKKAAAALPTTRNGAMRDVSFVVCDLAGFDKVWEAEPSAAQRSVELYTMMGKLLAHQHHGHIFSEPSLHSGGTIMMSFASPLDAATVALELQHRVSTSEWPLSTGSVCSRVTIHFNAGEIAQSQQQQQQRAVYCSSYPVEVYQEALDLNSHCPLSAVVCSPAFREALEKQQHQQHQHQENDSDGDDENHEKDLFKWAAFSKHKGFILLPASSDRVEQENEEGEGGDLSSRPRTDTICSSNRCLWIIHSRDIELKETLGEGSYGRVNRGTYKGSLVAVKRLFNSRLDDEGMGRMRREAAILSRLRHPNVVRLIGLSIAEGNLLLVMELAPRGSLCAILANYGSIKLAWTRKLALVRDAAAGVHFLHQNGIIHRDIKSSNLLVDDDWRVKVGDFGFATAKQDNCTLTRCGTPAWTAPEILSPQKKSKKNNKGKKTSNKDKDEGENGEDHETANESYDEKADVYSFGIVMWEILTRKKPYSDSNPVSVAIDVLNGLRPPVPADGDAQYVQLMQRCWSESPKDRPSIQEVLTYCDSTLGQTEEV